MVTAHVYTSEPWRSETIFGSTGPTIVWSNADRNMPSRTAPRISSFALVLRPSAGSSLMSGPSGPPVRLRSGNDSIGLASLLVGGGAHRCVGEVMTVGRARLDLRVQCAAQASECLENDRPL